MYCSQCTVCDIGDYANDLKVRKEVNDIFGYPQDHIPVTADDLLMFAVNLVEMYGIWEFDPYFRKKPDWDLFLRSAGQQTDRLKGIGREFIRQLTGNKTSNLG